LSTKQPVFNQFLKNCLKFLAFLNRRTPVCNTYGCVTYLWLDLIKQNLLVDSNMTISIHEFHTEVVQQLLVLLGNVNELLSQMRSPNILLNQRESVAKNLFPKLEIFVWLRIHKASTVQVVVKVVPVHENWKSQQYSKLRKRLGHNKPTDHPQPY